MASLSLRSLPIPGPGLPKMEGLARYARCEGVAPGCGCLQPRSLVHACSSGLDGTAAHASAQTLLWQQLVVDFGHELVTAIHVPLVWSNERPNPEEYAAAFHRVTLSASKVSLAVTSRGLCLAA